MRRRRLAVRAAVMLIVTTVTGCGFDSADDAVVRDDGGASRSAEQLQAVNGPSDDVALPRVPLYEPDPVEEFPNAKRVAGRAAAALLTYGPDPDVREVAARAGVPAARRAETVSALARIVEPREGSVGEVVYVQMAGTTETSFGAMVVVRRTTQDPTGRLSSETRVVDVRLERSGGPWTVAAAPSLGGARRRAPGSLSDAARAVVSSERIVLTDSAKWDIYRGGVSDSLLQALLEASKEHRFSVAVLASGHPRNVWATDRLSAHTSGAAADIYAVDGRLVIRQREADSPAARLAQRFFASGARQVGSPYDFDGPGRASFTDAVHQDHIHVQQAGVGE